MTERLEVMMDKVKFNRYCAYVMGYRYAVDSDTGNLLMSSGNYSEWAYNPYDDLNQMAEVFDKLWTECTNVQSMDYFLNLSGKSPSKIKQAMRDFIISTMQEDKE